MHFEENLIFLIRRTMHFLENHKQMINNAKAYLTYGLLNLSMIKNMLNGFIALFHQNILIHDFHRILNFLDRKFFIKVCRNNKTDSTLSKYFFEYLSIVFTYYLTNLL